mmetsp:Transcript_49704/g.106521  ORF Transcript_49704/g.106521 Transcript_49704/m.106521 type:complete len:93 (-) Transcript_49704:306-584(-)
MATPGNSLMGKQSLERIHPAGTLDRGFDEIVFLRKPHIICRNNTFGSIIIPRDCQRTVMMHMPDGSSQPHIIIWPIALHCITYCMRCGGLST